MSFNKTRSEGLKQANTPSQLLGCVASTTATPFIPLQVGAALLPRPATVTGTHETEKGRITESVCRCMARRYWKHNQKKPDILPQLFNDNKLCVCWCVTVCFCACVLWEDGQVLWKKNTSHFAVAAWGEICFRIRGLFDSHSPSL